MSVLNKSLLSYALAISAVGGVYSGVATAAAFDVIAAASNGTLVITGNVIAAPCSVSPDSTTEVKLGDVAVNDLVKHGHVSPQKVDIKLVGCVLDTDATTGGAGVDKTYSAVNVKFTGEFGSATASEDSDAFKNGGTATGVGVALYTLSNTKLTHDNLVTNGIDYPLTGADNDIQFMVAAVNLAKGSATRPTTGNIRTLINYTLTYK